MSATAKQSETAKRSLSSTEEFALIITVLLQSRWPGLSGRFTIRWTPRHILFEATPLGALAHVEIGQQFRVHSIDELGRAINEIVRHTTVASRLTQAAERPTLEA